MLEWNRNGLTGTGQKSCFQLFGKYVELLYILIEFQTSWLLKVVTSTHTLVQVFVAMKLPALEY